MPLRRRHAWVGFAISFALGIVGLLVFHGAAGGIICLVAMLSFIGACIYAVRGEDADAVTRSDRVGLAGWIGGWF